MALYRTLSISFWTDSKITDDFTPEDRYFYLYLLTNPHTNLSGCYEISIKQIANETGYSTDVVNNLIVRFTNFHNVIRYCVQTKEMFLLNWQKYNWTKSAKYRLALGKEIQKIKTTEFKEYLEKIYNGEEVESEIDTVSIPYAYGSDTSNTITNTITITNANANAVTVANANANANAGEKKPTRHKYGEYNNVLLTDEDYEKLVNEFPNDYQSRIENLSSYIASTGKSYKNHLATIRNWARREKETAAINKPVNKAAQEMEESYAMIEDWANSDGKFGTWQKGGLGGLDV